MSQRIIAIDYTVTKTSTQSSPYRRTVGPWGTQEVLILLCAAHARRITFPTVRTGRAIWGVTEDGDAWLTSFDNDNTSACRHYFRMDGEIHCLLDLEGSTLTDLKPKTKVTGRNVRDVLRKSMPQSGYQLTVSMFQHHISVSDDIVNSWQDGDFEFHLTMARNHPMACPYFDWDYIDERVKAFNKIQHKEAIRQMTEDDADLNVLHFPTGTADG